MTSDRVSIKPSYDFQVLGLICKVGGKRLKVFFSGVLREDECIKNFLHPPSQQKRACTRKKWAKDFECEHDSSLVTPKVE